MIETTQDTILVNSGNEEEKSYEDICFCCRFVEWNDKVKDDVRVMCGYQMKLVNPDGSDCPWRFHFAHSQRVQNEETGAEVE